MTGRSWAPAAAERGTVVLLPGRGEHAGVYQRFGSRLAADGYLVHAVDLSTSNSGQSLPDLVAKHLAEASGPAVLAGSDTGALAAANLLATGIRPLSGVVLAGVALEGVALGETDLTDWGEELDARTACPVHRSVLSEDPGVARGALAGPPPADLISALGRATLGDIAVPVLLLHGDQDVVTPLAQVQRLAARLPLAELAVVRGGRHDIVNDAHHRSVAAQLVQWLERLRLAPDAAPIVDVHRGGGG